jgi:hypothetical protein
MSFKYTLFTMCFQDGVCYMRYNGRSEIQAVRDICQIIVNGLVW